METLLSTRVVKQWSRLPRVVVESPSLVLLKVWEDSCLSNPLCMALYWTRWSPGMSSNLSQPVTARVPFGLLMWGERIHRYIYIYTLALQCSYSVKLSKVPKLPKQALISSAGSRNTLSVLLRCHAQMLPNVLSSRSAVRRCTSARLLADEQKYPPFLVAKGPTVFLLTSSLLFRAQSRNNAKASKWLISRQSNQVHDFPGLLASSVWWYPQTDVSQFLVYLFG